MSRVQKRGRAVLALAVVSLATPGCYGTRAQPSHVAWANTGYSFEDKSNVQVGVQRTVRELGAGSGVEFRVEETPICAERRVGRADVTMTMHKEVRRGVSVPLRLLLLATSATVVGVGAKHMRNGEKLRGGIMVGVGGLVTFVNAIVGKLPADKEVSNSETLPVTQISAAPDSWVACGEPKPVQSDVVLAFEANGNHSESSLRTDADGVLKLPQSLASDLQSWSQACGTNIRLTASVAEGAQTIDQLRRGSARLDYKLDDGNYFELGGEEVTPTRHVRGGPPTSLFLTPGPQLTNVSLGTTAAATYALACTQAAKQKQHATCLSKEAARNQATCEQSCISVEKREECSVRSEICVEQTAGITALQADCTARMNKCLASVQQDADSVQRCTQSCQSAAASRACSDT